LPKTQLEFFLGISQDTSGEAVSAYPLVVDECFSLTIRMTPETSKDFEALMWFSTRYLLRGRRTPLQDVPAPLLQGLAMDISKWGVVEKVSITYA
jgi:hypothetical protein